MPQVSGICDPYPLQFQHLFSDDFSFVPFSGTHPPVGPLPSGQNKPKITGAKLKTGRALKADGDGWMLRARKNHAFFERGLRRNGEGFPSERGDGRGVFDRPPAELYPPGKQKQITERVLITGTDNGLPSRSPEQTQ